MPGEFESIQAAVDAAAAGDLVLIAPGVYNEAVNVVTDEIVIRGLEREGVVLDVQFEPDNGIRVLGAKGVAVVDHFLSEHNGLGYSGTNAGGNLSIINSTFRFNRAGVVPNSGSYELCYPQRINTIVGNTIYSNNNPNTPAIDVAMLAMGNGVVVAGGIANTIERNLIYDHDKTGIALTPFLEDGANDDLPSEDEWALTCDEQRTQPLTSEIPESVLWEPYDNIVQGNVISDSRVADIAVEAVSVPTGSLRNCWAGNVITNSQPADLDLAAITVPTL